MIIAERQDVIGEAAARFGKLEPGRLAKDRGDLDYIRVFVGKAGVVGVPLARLPMPAGFQPHIHT
jgi:putative transport protein